MFMNMINANENEDVVVLMNNSDKREREEIKLRLSSDFMAAECKKDELLFQIMPEGVEILETIYPQQSTDMRTCICTLNVSDLLYENALARMRKGELLAGVFNFSLEIERDRKATKMRIVEGLEVGTYAFVEACTDIEIVILLLAPYIMRTPCLAQQLEAIPFKTALKVALDLFNRDCAKERRRREVEKMLEDGENCDY